MEFDSVTHSLGMAAQVFFLDLLLSGDNALVIALACRGLPSHLVARAVMFGTGFAILLRVLLTWLASSLLEVPLLKLVGAVLLLIIAIKLLLGDDDDELEAMRNKPEINQLGAAIMMVVTADLVLSLDNVVALAAATQGSMLFLIVGLLLSIPLLMYGSLFITRLLAAYPLLIPAGSALLAWIAGQIAVTDPLIAAWVEGQAPALTVVVPLLCVVFVLCESRIIREQKQTLAAPPSLDLLSRLTQRFTQLGDADTVTSVTVAASGTSALLPPEPVVKLQPAAPLPAPTLALACAVAATPPSPAVVASDAVAEDDASVPDTPAAGRRLQYLIWGVVAVGVLGLGWILVHVLSQGFMPVPEHPAAAQHYPK